MFTLVDCVRYNEDFVKSRLCSIHFTVILAGLKKIVRFTEDVIWRFTVHVLRSSVSRMPPLCLLAMTFCSSQ